ncbi:hypothetical protein ACIO1C_21060 [Streptomyces sp. NPDC087420]|uniref:hypothetical protein n=1 Tax=Streptomyces sp. NPDC087420 TaxID=3365785 RepID=UPI0038340AF5
MRPGDPENDRAGERNPGGGDAGAERRRAGAGAGDTDTGTEPGTNEPGAPAGTRPEPADQARTDAPAEPKAPVAPGTPGPPVVPEPAAPDRPAEPASPAAAMASAKPGPPVAPAAPAALTPSAASERPVQAAPPAGAAASPAPEPPTAPSFPRRTPGILPPRDHIALRSGLALSGWVALAATALPDGSPSRWIPVLLFVSLGPGLALLLPQRSRPAARLEVLALAAPLSLSLATLAATALFLVSGFSATLFLAALATVTTLASLLPALPLPAATRQPDAAPEPDPEAPR